MKEEKKRINNDFLKWLDNERAKGVNKWFTVYEVCRALKKCPNTSAYRKFYRMVAYGELEHKYNAENHSMLFRKRKK